MDHTVSLYQFKDLFSNMRKSQMSLYHFTVECNYVNFDVIVDIGNTPFELMIGAVRHNWACTLLMEKGFKVSMGDSDYKRLCHILNLQPQGQNHFTSMSFLKHIAAHIPPFQKQRIVQPNILMRFRQHKISKADDPEKNVFLGWNDHQKDKRSAQNFAKTELFFGKNVADYCRKHNISSLWTTPEQAGNQIPDACYPTGYTTT